MVCYIHNTDQRTFNLAYNQGKVLCLQGGYNTEDIALRSPEEKDDW